MTHSLPEFKILILGDSGVGKTSFLKRFVHDEFDSQQKATISIDLKVKSVNIDGNTVKLLIWDTAGQERFNTLSQNYYRGAYGAILIYSVDSKGSYMKIEHWLNELNCYSQPNIVIMIIGSKIDLNERKVSKEEGMKLAKKHGALFMETSALTGEGVQRAFEELTLKIIQTPGSIGFKDDERFMLQNKPQGNRSWCLRTICP